MTIADQNFFLDGEVEATSGRSSEASTAGCTDGALEMHQRGRNCRCTIVQLLLMDNARRQVLKA
jgi:hypothetical protein